MHRAQNLVQRPCLYAALEASANTLKQQRPARLQFPDVNVQHPNA